MCSLLSGLLQSPGQRQTAQAACDRQGQVLQPTGRGEDQGSGRSLCADGIMLLSVCFCKINCVNGTWMSVVPECKHLCTDVGVRAVCCIFRSRTGPVLWCLATDIRFESHRVVLWINRQLMLSIRVECSQSINHKDYHRHTVSSSCRILMVNLTVLALRQMYFYSISSALLVCGLLIRWLRHWLDFPDLTWGFSEKYFTGDSKMETFTHCGFV